MVGAILVGALIYAAMVFVTAVVEPWAPMLGNPDWATGQAVQNTIGYVGLLFLGLAMLCAVLSGYERLLSGRQPSAVLHVLC